MSDLDITISVDPAKAVQGAKAVAAEVKRTEEEAKKAQAAFTSFGEQLARVARYEQLVAESAKKATEAHREIAAQTMANVRGFEGMAKAIKAEQDMLNSIQGPMRQHQQDLQVLNKLYREGKINAEEYARASAKSAGGAGVTPSGQNGQLSSIASGVASLNFKQVASGANQAFEQLNQKLHITETAFGSAVGSAVKFGATGAQVAGPWGAAIGAVVGVTADLVGKLFDAESETKKLRKEAEEQAKAYWESVHATEQKKKIEEALAPAMAEHARLAQEVAEREAAVKSALNAGHVATEYSIALAQAYSDQLYKVNGELAIKLALEAEDRRQKGTGQTDDENKSIANARGVRDATLAKDAANKSYGKTLLELEGAENKRNDRLRDLEQILADQQVSSGAQKKALAEYNKLVHEQTDEQKAAAAAAKAHAAEIEKLRKLMFDGAQFKPGSNNAQWEIEKAQREADIRSLDAQSEAVRNEALGIGARPSDYPSNEQIDASAKGVNNPAKDAKKSISDYDKALDSLEKESMADLRNAAQSLGASLVDAFDDADFSAKKLLKTFGDMALKMGVQAAINFGFNAAGIGGGATGFDYLASSSAQQLPGFATGGDMYTRGAGSTDSMLAMIRMTPGESLHVRTPEQRREAMRGGSARTININLPGTGRGRVVHEENIEGMVVRIVERNNTALRSRLRDD